MRRKKRTPSFDPPKVDVQPRSPEQFITDQLAALKANAQCALDEVGAHTQLHPHQALLWALAAGYTLRVLPITRIVGGLLRLTLSLLKPAAIVYGVSKLWHATQKGVPPRHPLDPASGRIVPNFSIHTAT